MRFMLPLAACLLLVLAASDSPAAGVILLRESFNKSSERFYDQLKFGLIAAGMPVEEVEAARLAQRLSAESDRGVVLVLPNSRYFPAEAKNPMQDFLKRGNHLFTVSGPPFKNLVVHVDDQWLTKPLAKVRLTHSRGEKIVDFSSENLTIWGRHSGTMDNPSEYAVVKSGDEDVPDALHAKLSKLDNWETFISPNMDKPFPDGHTATVFWAKGGPNTPELIVEWREKDGSRWMATVVITTEWVRYALVPTDFRYWSDNPNINRGQPGDSFRPENAEAISFGIASGISRQELGIAHEYWVSDLRAVRDEYKDVDFTPPVLESISPDYKIYSTTATEVELVPGGRKMPLAAAVLSPISRQLGLGSDDARRARFIPVLRALDQGEPRGTAAHLYVNRLGEYAGSVWGHLGFEQSFLEHTAGQTVPLVVSMIRQMRQGVFLLNGGVQHAAYEASEEIKSGAYVINLSNASVDARIEFAVLSGEKQAAQSSIVDVRLPASNIEKPLHVAGGTYKLPAGEYVLRTTLKAGGQVVDNIDQPFSVIKYAQVDPSEVVHVSNGDFILNGKPWHGHGMNYWPRYSMGQEGPDWSEWLSPWQYDPEIIEQDLALAEKLGVNLLSIQYMKADQARGLMDFLDRAHNHGVKVHIFIPGLDPLRPNFGLAESLIRSARLPQSPAFFAYDVGWEVNVGPYDRRRLYDEVWQKWVIDQYGSIENAENDWHYKPERVDGVITGPKDDQLQKDGPWNVYVAAYRHFWDDEISRRYRNVRQFLNDIDPHALVCARSGYGGTGSVWAAQFFPFDLASGAKHLDFTSPEAYALGGDRLGFLKGGLITLYGRFVSGGKPVFWAEHGMSIWPQCNEEMLENQRRYYENMFYMISASGANGSAGWWWPGGYRFNEKSDFGITNPDGTPRPAALELQKAAETLKSPRAAKSPDMFIEIDRDKYAAGIAGIYAEHQDVYVEAVESGKTPAVRTAGTGTTSADCPLTAVGNVPYTGSNPPKYLNAEFNYVKINGEVVENGATVQVERDKPVYLEASVGNTQEAAWLAPSGAKNGGVYLFARPEDGVGEEIRAPISTDTPFLSDALVQRTLLSAGLKSTTRYTLRMIATDRAEFGEVFRVTLAPK